MEKKLKYNSFSTITYQIVAIIVGLIIPRLILVAYGSEVNGLTYSISQMLSIISYLDFGISAVAQAALYKPIVKKDRQQISIVYSAIHKYFKMLTGILIIYVLLLCFYYGLIRNDDFSSLYTTTLVLSIGISFIGQYLWGISNQVLLAADQKIYIYTIWNIVTTCLNAFTTYLLIRFGQPIQVVKLVASFIFLLKPIALQIYVNKVYDIKIVDNVSISSLPEQWSGLIQHVATTLTASLDTIILTLVSTMSNVSIYNVYVFPLNGMRVLIESIGGGYKSYFGHLLVGEDKEKLNLEFDKYEIVIHFLATVFVCCCFKLLIPFVLLYTKGVDDANYNHYGFMIFIILAYYVMLIRIPYTTIVTAAGHFKKTQGICIIEVLLNIVVSFIAVFKFGLVGVAIGTLIAVLYKMYAFVVYLNDNILLRKKVKFFEILIVDLFSCVIFCVITTCISLNIRTYFDWFCAALLYFVVSIFITLGVLFMIKKKIVMNIIQSSNKKFGGR